MQIYKPTFTYKGKQKDCKVWYLRFTDNRQTRRRLPAFTNRRATERAAGKIEDLLSSGGVITPEIQKWFDGEGQKLVANLIKFGLIANRRLSEHLTKTLREHLDDFTDGLKADNRKTAYINQVKSSIIKTLDGCKFDVWGDIDGNKVKTFLTKSRGKDGYGERTYNNYLRAFKEFTAWLIQEDRVTGSDPMKPHKLIKQTEFRKKRRALTIDEMHKLLKATEAAPDRYNMTGQERSLVYRLALETGLRSNEIKTLKVLSFDFENNGVHVDASNSKGKRSYDLILMSDTAKDVKELLRGKLPTATAFGMPHTANTALMLKDDLKVAEIPYTDDSGRDVDFHALRHTFITNLCRAGVHPTVAQKMARHSSIELTMRYFSPALRESEVAAVDALKSLSNSCSDGEHKRKDAV